MYAFFLLSLLSKPAAVSFPLALLAVDYYRDGRITRRHLVDKIPLFCLSALFGGIAILGTYTPVDPDPFVYPFSWMDRIFLSCSALVRYLEKLILPVELSPFYAYPKRSQAGLLPAGVYLSVAAPAVIVWAICADRFRNRSIRFGALFFAGTIVVNLPLLSVGHTIMADRFVYLPGLGIWMILAEIAQKGRLMWGQRPPFRMKMMTGVGAYLLFLSVMTWNQTQIWHDSAALWSAAIRVDPSAPLPYYNRADHFVQTGEIDAALADYDRALAAHPEYPQALNNRGNMLVFKGELLSAEESYSRAIALAPRFIDPYFNRAVCRALLGRPQHAIEDYDRILLLEPGNSRAREEKQKLLPAIDEKMRSRSDESYL